MWEFDSFMNLMIDECVEMVASGQQNNIRMVVIEGNSIIMFRSFGTRINNGYVQQKN